MKMKILNLLKGVDDAIFDNVGPIRVLYVIRNTIGYQCLIPLIRKTMGDDGFHVAITLEHDGCFEFSDDEESQNIKRKHFIKTERALYKKWHYVFFTDQTGLYFRRNATLVHTSHGPCIGNADSTSPSRGYWEKSVFDSNKSLIFCDGKAREMLIQNNMERKNRCFLTTGFAKADGIVNLQLSSVERNKIYENFKLRPDFKNVVIFSHWTPKSLLSNFNAEDLEQLCVKFPEYNFIAMGHQLLWENHDGSDRKNGLFDELKELESKQVNFSFTPKLKETIELLKIADFFIGDNSSFYIEACLVNKPIYFYDHPEFNFSMPEVGSLYKAASVSFSNPLELLNRFSLNENEPDLYERNRKEVVDHFLYKPGLATDYMIESLKEMGRVSGPESRSWSKVVEYCRKERGRLK